MSDYSRGLYEKYAVIRGDGQSESGKKHENCFYFVLDLTHDPHAYDAFAAYADSCAENKPELAADIWEWLKLNPWNKTI